MLLNRINVYLNFSNLSFSLASSDIAFGVRAALDEREIGDAAFPGERRMHTSPSAPPIGGGAEGEGGPPPQQGPLANEHAVSSDVSL